MYVSDTVFCSCETWSDVVRHNVTRRCNHFQILLLERQSSQELNVGETCSKDHPMWRYPSFRIVVEYVGLDVQDLRSLHQLHKHPIPSRCSVLYVGLQYYRETITVILDHVLRRCWGVPSPHNSHKVLVVYLDWIDRSVHMSYANQSLLHCQPRIHLPHVHMHTKILTVRDQIESWVVIERCPLYVSEGALGVVDLNLATARKQKNHFFFLFFVWPSHD